MKFANLRAFYGYMMAHPGKKMIFMGGEFAQFIEWRYDEALEWFLLDYEAHSNTHLFVKELFSFYKNEKALWQIDRSWDGFKWINPGDAEKSILSFVRMGKSDREKIVVVCNFTPEKREGYIIGVPQKGVYYEVFNTDDTRFGGGGVKNYEIMSEAKETDGFKNRISLTLPPLSVVFLKRKVVKRENI